MSDRTADGWYRHIEEGTGRRYNLDNLTAAKPGGDTSYEYRGVRPPHGRYWAYSRANMERMDAEGRLVLTPTGKLYVKRYLDESKGSALQDIWLDIDMLRGFSSSKERLGFPTQKPVALLERILELSTRSGDVVLDPFSGCGTAVDAAQGLGRRWIGIDITHLSIGLIKHRLVGRYGPEIVSTYRVVGEPTTADDAAVLAREDPFQFQAWALGLVGARIAGSDKRGGDKGIDGRLYFHDSVSGPTRQVVFSVKAGHLVPAYVRDLRGVLERESAEIGVLLSFQEPSAGMRSEAAEAGFYESPWGRHPRIQLRTIRELLDGKGIDYPHVTGANVTHRRAQRARATGPEAMELFGRPEGEISAE
ncbi:MAG: site-specific DNA-methyltransferase [Chloroflexi bacterium]|nr:site-specific DNA-methyltransferase [Chloroflexota bacterium]